MQNERYQAVKRVNFISAGVNAFQSLLKMVVGTVGHSSALFADGIHSLADLLSNALVWIASKIGRAPPDFEHPYGHGRFETIGSFILGLFLLGTAVGIAWDAVVHLLNREWMVPQPITLIMAILSIVLNECVFRYSMIIAKRVQSSLLRANAYHSRADSLTSLVVVFGILGAMAGLHFADAIATVLVAGFIVKIGLELTWHAVEELTDRGVSAEQIKAFEAVILNLSGVRQMHQLRTRKMRDRIFLDVHILIAPYASASEGHYIAETVHYHLKQQFGEIEDMTIHIDTEDHPEKVPDRLMPDRRAIEAFFLPALRPLLPDHHEIIDLFYFREYIEMQVILPLSVLGKNPAPYWQAKIEEMVHPIKEIKKVIIRFSLTL